jgi:hypothetical protein
MILKLSDYIDEDVHDVLNPVVLQSSSYQNLLCLGVNVLKISSIVLYLKWLTFVDAFKRELRHLDYDAIFRKIMQYLPPKNDEDAMFELPIMKFSCRW